MAKYKDYPTKELIRELFQYREDGVLVRRVRTANSNQVGDVISSSDSNGYIRTNIKGSNYKVHRLIYIYHYGNIPDGIHIDHINGVVDDNRIDNLQTLSTKDNIRKQKTNCRNTSGHRGITFSKKKRKWQAQITVDELKMWIGYYDTPEEAALAYDQAAMIHYGRFATLNFNNQIIDIVNKHLGPIRM